MLVAVELVNVGGAGRQINSFAFVPLFFATGFDISVSVTIGPVIIGGNVFGSLGGRSRSIKSILSITIGIGLGLELIIIPAECVFKAGLIFTVPVAREIVLELGFIVFSSTMPSIEVEVMLDPALTGTVTEAAPVIGLQLLPAISCILALLELSLKSLEFALLYRLKAGGVLISFVSSSDFNRLLPLVAVDGVTPTVGVVPLVLEVELDIAPGLGIALVINCCFGGGGGTTELAATVDMLILGVVAAVLVTVTV